MKKLFPNKTSILITICSFLLILTNSFLCFLVNPIKDNHSEKLFILLTFIVLIFGLTIFLNIVFIKKCSNKNNMIFINTFSILLSAVICTITYKIATIINSNTIFSKTGLTSVIFLFSFYALILVISLVPFLKKEKEKAFSEKQI